MQPFKLTPLPEPGQRVEPDMALIQGWDNAIRVNFNQPHPMPSLLELELMRSGAPTGVVFPVRGPAVTLGRYSPESGPVDVDLSVLLDHERYQVAELHLRLGLEPEGWWVEPLDRDYPTTLDDAPLRRRGGRLKDGSVLRLGQVTLRVRTFRHAPRALKNGRPRVPCLRYKCDGAPSAAAIPLQAASLVLGRYSPWTGPVDVDLSGLEDTQRVHVARRHARLLQRQHRWYVEAATPQRSIFINRKHLKHEAVALLNGDEIALGNTFFLFQDVRPSSRPEPHDAPKRIRR